MDKSVLIQGRKYVFDIETGAEETNLLGFVIINMLSSYIQSYLWVML